MTTEDKDDIVAPTDLLPHDVVLGKMASGNFSSPGNRLFKQFLMKKKRDYSQVSSHSGKKRFLAQCVEEWCNRMEGRFLFRETTILCTVVKSEEERAKLLTKVNALMRNLPSPSSLQAAEPETGSATVPIHEVSHTTPKKQRKITSVAAAVTVSSTSSDASESDGNESQAPESNTSPVETTPDTRKKHSLSVVTEDRLLEDSHVKEKKDDTSNSDALISSDSSTDEMQNMEVQTKETPAALTKKNHLRPSPTSIAGFHQVQEDETVREESSP
jgi:hypothetical protein